MRVLKDTLGHFLRVPSANIGKKNENFIGHTVCRWRTIYRTEPIITGNVRRSDGHWGTLTSAHEHSAMMPIPWLCTLTEERKKKEPCIYFIYKFYPGNRSIQKRKL